MHMAECTHQLTELDIRVGQRVDERFLKALNQKTRGERFQKPASPPAGGDILQPAPPPGGMETQRLLRKKQKNLVNGRCERDWKAEIDKRGAGKKGF